MAGLSPGDPIWQFCGFVNGSSFRTKYFMDESTMTLTPCGEMFLVFIQNIPLFFWTVLNFSFISRHYARFDISAISFIFSYRIVACIATIIALAVSILLSHISVFTINSAYMIEYVLLALIWTNYMALWIFSLKCKSWTRSTGLIVTVFFASKSFHLITVNRWLLYGFYDPRTYIIFTVSIFHLINIIPNIIEWRLYKAANLHDSLPTSLDDGYIRLDERGDEGANFLSKIFFWWTKPLIKKGGKRQIKTLDDIFNLPPSLQVDQIEHLLVESSPTFFSDAQPSSLFGSLMATFGLPFFSLGLLRLASDAFTFAGPILLHLFITNLELAEPTKEVFIEGGLIILFSFLAAMCANNFNFYVQKITLKVRSGIVTTLYEKLLRVPLWQMSSFSSGQILNFITTDVDRMVNFCNSFHAFWSLPIQLCIALYLLYREVGMAFISGLVAAIILIPINKIIMNFIGSMSTKLMACKDERIKLITETMEGIRTVKLSAWENFFMDKINVLREKELHYLKARKYLDALCVYLWASAPLLITISILATYTMVLHEKLTAAKVFTSLALVNILIMPLNAFPWVLNGLIEAHVSLKRLEWFFGLNDMDFREIYTLNREHNSLLAIKEGNFFWKSQAASSTVSGVNFNGREGNIIGITGDVGSGKSSLLLGLLGETRTLAEGLSITQHSMSNGIGYLGQERWLSRGTIRDNILSGKDYEEDLYASVLKATCLQRDVAAMPGGDQYEISDNGASLSGGQRTRVALARALYQDTLVYLLDEPFASLDKDVADSIWRDGIEGLRKKGKLIIVATHETRLLTRADTVLVLARDGRVKKIGPPSKALEDSVSTELGADSMSISEQSVDLERIVQQEEEKQIGAVQLGVYKAYGHATGICLSAMIIASLMVMQTTKNGADWWLSRWTEASENGTSYNQTQSLHSLLWAKRVPIYESDDELQRSLYFLYIYAAIALANTIFTLIRSFLFAFGGVVAARNLHQNLLVRLLQAPLSWWNRTPSGRVINRICADVYTCDDNLPFQMNILMASLFGLMGTLVITVMGLPLMAPFVILLFIGYFFIQKYYRMTTVELKRLTSLSLSPFYSHLKDTVNGLVTIRAQRFTQRFSALLYSRLNDNLRAQYSSLAAGQWLSIRLSLIAVAVVAAIAIMAVVQHRITGVNSGLVGLAITYALSMTNLLNGLLGSFIETEKEMVSVERINEYVENVPKEEDHGHGNVRDLNGRIDFASVSLRYDAGLPLALSNVCLRVEAGQRAAIIGRTGSGKSSIFQALLRATPIESGRVSVDGVDIDNFSLKYLRTCIGVVPQQPFIFSGSLYDNLVVGNNDSTDRAALTRLLRNSKLESLLTRIGGLDGIIEEGGKNLSYGEKQVIAICRVIIQKPKILLIDEATSHMDTDAHIRMMSLINEFLSLSTVISIVHKLDSLDEYDLVVRMEQGKIISVERKTDRTVSGNISG